MKNERTFLGTNAAGFAHLAGFLCFVLAVSIVLWTALTMH